jgi:hypothetical protein
MKAMKPIAVNDPYHSACLEKRTFLRNKNDIIHLFSRENQSRKIVLNMKRASILIAYFYIYIMQLKYFPIFVRMVL